ncbi:hypothetical protein TraAM80_08584 [Trypanosoma rangeli]|uniref:Uncharacterized protein n=1 Tax=Trypanosoma rangeli TaxID=5698 RepID=A0A3R7N8Y7_TRYRA|nr:uncharacterized protein TraAM80_08584 [Trypanosoma rangeli]RNE98734.1 hypothetical protein TraAM80_08584 [Trypanosoma rangeli]|eukprot:RNE98734.1 hypothetical protein TraAM80_08584 [Trypanosoma rangeli]
MRKGDAAVAGGSNNSGEKKNRAQTHLNGAGTGRMGKKGKLPGRVPAPTLPNDVKQDNIVSPSVRIGVPQQRVMSIDKEFSLTSPVMGTTTSSATGSRSCAMIADPWVILQPSQPPALLGWAARRETTSESSEAHGATNRLTAMSRMKNAFQIGEEFLTRKTSGGEGCACNCYGRNAQRLELRFASPSEKRRDFTRPADPCAEAMRRLEEEHHQRFRRVLYRLQQMYPDPWWRLQSSAYYDAGAPEVLACDDSPFFSRVAGDVRDAGVMWLSLKSAAP